ncbi:MAG: DUF61 family protein [Methanocalculus sp. MSAO_Arc2]|uniref:DUF61 family protein n=1 Tax=Methanocalculus sp. MSAO_Arc2 TaxID=2293855 RepID=UPI000FF5537A|nr:MAG: DUF61 family protein [Methanocalculus sp. MSAO_Arc2]
MRDGSFFSDERVLTKWMRLEYGKINEGIVTEKKSLAELLSEPEPCVITKGGTKHIFDRDVLRVLGEQLPEDLHHQLKLPITFFQDMEVTDSTFLTDAVAVKALQLLRELGESRRLVEGRIWISRPIVYAIVLKYPTAVQIMMR